MIQFIFLAVPLLDVVWFLWAWWRTGAFPRRAWWRGLISAFFILMLTHFLWMMLFRRAQVGVGPPPITLGMAYIWHLLILPVVTILLALAELVVAGGKAVMKKPSPDESQASNGGPSFSRRQFLATAAVAAPPALTVLSGLGGYRQSLQFRVRRIEAEMPALPPELDGVTIAHVSDIHAGKFVDEKHMARIAAATNDLRADLIVLTGDLIDFALSDLPAAIAAVRRMDAAGGVYLCEGNHDLFEGRKEFESGVKDSGLALLINESANVRLRGRNVQIHGLRWGATEERRDHSDDAGAGINLGLMQESIDPEAFSVLLAHHPHAFDAATAMGIPLTLAGHTHGGQLMLTPEIGAGPLMYRYWSGLYRQGLSRLVVSNGVGNWLPLRINAPAEIIHLTLRSTALA